MLRVQKKTLGATMVLKSNKPRVALNDIAALIARNVALSAPAQRITRRSGAGVIWMQMDDVDLALTRDTKNRITLAVCGPNALPKLELLVGLLSESYPTRGVLWTRHRGPLSPKALDACQYEAKEMYRVMQAAEMRSAIRSEHSIWSRMAEYVQLPQMMPRTDP